jgi:hypothetical protein
MAGLTGLPVKLRAFIDTLPGAILEYRLFSSLALSKL